MRPAGQPKDDDTMEQGDTVSLCSMYADSESFGIDTGTICEVLGERELERVPLSPPFIAGVVPYRGEVLTTVNLRALLGMKKHPGPGCVLVMEDAAAEERFGLVVDGVGRVVTVSRKSLEPIPCTLEPRAKWLFLGAYKMEAGLMVQLNSQRLRPALLAETSWFRQGRNGGLDASSDRR